MQHFLKIVLILFLLLGSRANAQQSQSGQQGFKVVPPGETDLITPVNIKPLDLEEFARRRGLNAGAPVRNLVILSGFALIEDQAAIFRATRQKKLQINEMENFALVLPRFVEKNHDTQLKLMDFLTGDGRAVGVVSDSRFRCSTACEFISIDSEKLFTRARMALTMAEISAEEERDRIVRDFCRRNIEYARNRKDLDRLFSAKAEKIVGAFRTNHFIRSEDQSQPGFDELVNACLSRLTVEKNGFVLLVGSHAAEEAALEGRHVDMIEHLKLQEKVLHQINYFVSGRKDTLVLILEDSGKIRLSYAQDFSLTEFLNDVDLISSAFKAKDLNRYFFEIERENTRLLHCLDHKKLKMLITADDRAAIFAYLQKTLADCYKLEARLNTFKQRFPGFAVFSRGHSSEIFRGMLTFDEFINCLALVSGLKNDTVQE